MGEAVTAVILAGGESRRLGFDKTALRVGGKTLLQRTVELLWAWSEREVIVVTNSPQEHAQSFARCVTDIYSGKGVLGGIYTGLTAAQTQRCLVVGADMPFLNPNVLTYLASLAPDHDVVAPFAGENPEPLHAIYSRACLGPIESRLQADSVPRIISFYDAVRVRRVGAEELQVYDPLLLSLFNINTPEDVQRARSILQACGLDLDAPCPVDA